MSAKKIDIKIDDLMIKELKGQLYSKVIKDTERALIEKALERSFGNQSIASKLLGINRNTLRTKIKNFNIDVTKFKIK